MTGPHSLANEDLFAPARDLFRSWGDALMDANAIGTPQDIAVEEPVYLVDSAEFDLPVEIQIVSSSPDGSTISLRASSPTQKTETTVLPVWHRIRIGLELTEADDGSVG